MVNLNEENMSKICQICNETPLNSLKYEEICINCTKLWNRFWHRVIHQIDHNSVDNFYKIYVKSPELQGLYELSDIYDKYLAKFSEAKFIFDSFQEKILLMAVGDFCEEVQRKIIDKKFLVYKSKSSMNNKSKSRKSVSGRGSCSKCRIYKIAIFPCLIKKPRISLLKLTDLSWKNSQLINKGMELEYCILDLLMITNQKIIAEFTKIFGDKPVDNFEKTSRTPVLSEKTSSNSPRSPKNKKAKFELLSSYNVAMLQNNAHVKIQKGKQNNKTVDQNKIIMAPEQLFANLKINLSDLDQIKDRDLVFDYANKLCKDFIHHRENRVKSLNENKLVNFELLYFNAQPQMSNIFILTTQILKDFGRVFNYRPDDTRKETLERYVDINIHDMKKLSMDFDQSNFPDYMLKNNAASIEQSKIKTRNDFFNLATTCQDHQYSICFELLKNPILNQLIQNLSGKLVHYFQKLGVQSTFNFDKISANYQSNAEILKILSEMQTVLPSGNFGYRNIISLYPINLFRLIIHFVIGIYCIDDKDNKNENVNAKSNDKLSDKFRNFNPNEQETYARVNFAAVKFMETYKINYFSMMLSSIWREIVVLNYCEKYQLFVLPGNFYFTVDDFNRGLDFLANDENALKEIKEPLRNLLKQELPHIRQMFFDFTRVIQNLNNFEIDLIFFMISLKMSRLHNTFFSSNVNNTSPNDWRGSTVKNNSNSSVQDYDDEMNRKFNQSIEGASRFLFQSFSLKFSKLSQITDNFIDFMSLMGFFLPFLCAVKRPEGTTEDQYRRMVYEISKEMVIEHPW